MEQLALSPQPLAWLLLAKTTAHWLISGLPLVIMSPVVATSLAMPAEAMPALMLSLALGTPILSLVGAIGAGLTVGLQRGSVLLSLLVMPLVMPVLIWLGLSDWLLAAACLGAPAFAVFMVVKFRASLHEAGS